MQTGAGATRAVFVDPSGRRGRLVSRTCWALGALGVAYVLLVVVSLLLPPSLTRLTVPGLGRVLPGPGAPALTAEGGGKQAPETLLAPSPSPRRPSPSAEASPSPASDARSAATPAPSTAAPAAPPPPASPAAAPVPAAPGPTVAPSPRSTRAPSTQPAARPTRSPKPRPDPTRGPR